MTTRRNFLGLAGAGGLLTGSGATAWVMRRRERPPGPAAEKIVDPYGPYQAGILTTPQTAVVFTSYDLGTRARRALINLLRGWTEAIVAMTTGGRVPELTGVGPSRLTATVGIGIGLAEKAGVTPPAGLVPLPRFAGDEFSPPRCGGDLCVQVCADDGLAAARATAALTRLAEGVATPRWQQVGFRSDAQHGTPRNLFGFADGSANPRHPRALAQALWLTGPGPHAGGTYLVVRQIAMDVAGFGRLPVATQEAMIGRRKESGAPLGGHAEFDTPDLAAKTPQGRYVIPVDAHVRRASALAVGASMLRRAYNYVNSPQDQGLLFLAFQKNPEVFVQTQRRLGVADALARFTVTRGSGLFFVLPGIRRGEWLGQRVLAGP